MKTYLVLMCTVAIAASTALLAQPVELKTMSAEVRNEVTMDGLKIGRWMNEYTINDEQLTAVGSYKVVPRYHTYPLLDSFGFRKDRRTYTVAYKGATPLWHVEGDSDDLVSVKDSAWYIFDSTGALYGVSFWINGIESWFKRFDRQGNIVQHRYKDFDNDTSFNLAYVQQQLFRKGHYPPYGEDGETVVYYPDRDLVIENAEPRLYANYLSKTTDTFRIRLTARKNASVAAIRTTTEHIKFEDADYRNITFPVQIVPGDTLLLNMIFSPAAAAFREFDTVFISTSEVNAEYALYCRASVSHLDGHNIENVQSVTLSKTNDRYLIVAPMGSVTDAYITNAQGEEKSYSIQGITRIALDELEVGYYNLAVLSCSKWGRMTLTIVE